jgi:hypothetical protein
MMKTTPDNSQSKKAYQQPQLQVYGSLKDVTKMVGSNGVSDGGGIPNFNRTSA